MIEILAGLIFAFAVGAICRWFDIPSPAPPKIVGALLVVAMTVGFLATDFFLTAPTPPASLSGSR
jgi:XapX domain-containing protein